MIKRDPGRDPPAKLQGGFVQGRWKLLPVLMATYVAILFLDGLARIPSAISSNSLPLIYTESLATRSTKLQPPITLFLCTCTRYPELCIIVYSPCIRPIHADDARANFTKPHFSW